MIPLMLTVLYVTQEASSLTVKCDQIWSATLTAVLDARMQIVSSDRHGGLLTFVGPSDDYPVPPRSVLNRKRGDIEEVFRGLVNEIPNRPLLGFRIENSTVVLVPTNEGCRIRIDARIVGIFDAGRSTVIIPLESNGKLERGLLQSIEKRAVSK